MALAPPPDHPSIDFLLRGVVHGIQRATIAYLECRKSQPMIAGWQSMTMTADRSSQGRTALKVTE